MAIELQPDTSEVIQEEADDRVTVPVCVVEQEAPVRVQELPRKGGATMTKTLGTTAQRVLTADHRRGAATIIGHGDGLTFLVAYTETAAQAEATMALWPTGVPLVVDATTEVWLSVPANPGTAVTVGILTSLWAEGR